MYYFKAQEKPRRWGSFQDVQYAIRKNAEKIYQVDPDSMVLCMPLFWGLPPLDYSGFNNHGTNHGTTHKDRGLDFGGSFNYVQTTSDELKTADNFAISVWFKTDTTASGGFHIVWQGHSGSNGWGGELPNKDELHLSISRYNVANLLLFYFGHHDDGNSPYHGGDNIEVTTAFTDISGWHHAVAVVSYSDPTYTGELFLDGVSVDTDTGTQGARSAWDTKLRLGRPGVATRFFNGLMAEARISNIAPTADQIALFHDRSWDLYRPVSRPVYSIPAAPSLYIPQIIIF